MDCSWANLLSSVLDSSKVIVIIVIIIIIRYELKI
jgi:hypothetical protein